MNTLNGKQKRFLKAEAHHLKPLAQIGKPGLTPAFTKELEALLERHELVKIKFNEYKDQRKELFKEMAVAVEGQAISLVGNTAIIFKQNIDEKKQRYSIPG